MPTKFKLIIVFSTALLLSACGKNSVSHDQLMETFSPVCDGKPVEGSSDYQPREPGIHPMMVIGRDQISEMILEDYSKEIPDLNGKWKSRDAAATQLAACGSSSSHETGTCNYSGMIRKKYNSSFSISMYSTKDGTLIDRREWTCDGQCPNPLTDENADQLCYSAAPDAYEIDDWLQAYIDTPEWQESDVQFNDQITFELMDYNLREIALLDSKGITFLTSNLYEDKEPSQSPDGSKLAFTSNRDGVEAIHVMNGDGSDQKRITGADRPASLPAWSPDGRKIAFLSNSNIWLMNPDGTEQAELYDDFVPSLKQQSLDVPSLIKYSLEWSPDGTKILFRALPISEYDFELYVISADGTGLQQLTNNEVDDGNPHWSPDSTKIVFVSKRDIKGQDIFVVDASGSRLTQLSDYVEAQYDVLEATYDLPAWSPDGRQIAYVSLYNRKYSLHIMNADGSAAMKLADLTGDASNLTWSPDGSVIIFISGSAVYRVNADGTQLQRLSPAWVNESSHLLWRP